MKLKEWSDDQMIEAYIASWAERHKIVGFLGSGGDQVMEGWREERYGTQRLSCYADTKSQQL